jgi:hypothetical protein
MNSARAIAGASAATTNGLLEKDCMVDQWFRGRQTLFQTGRLPTIFAENGLVLPPKEDEKPEI